MHDDGSVEGCGWCHNPTVHYVQSPNDTDCFACHVEFVPEPQTAHGVELADRYTCIQCHEYHLFAVRARAHTPYGWFMSSGSPYLPADEIHIAHDGVNFWAFFPTCAPCHGNLLDEMNDCDWCHAIAERPVPIKPPVLEPPVVEPEPEPKPWYVIPGFGAISAIVLLLAAAFLAMRRR
ncbi:MAG: PGF-CTERM sorting domain-containing protein [Methanosarcinales archaeon Met12]|nr:MAG: PGF-CTERM sorting domain-containing protein [Methanosarcinales archaeon Met12]